MSEPLSEKEVTRMLQLVGGDADTPEEKDVAWDALVRNDARLRRHVAELEKERDELRREYESALGSIAAERDRGLRAEAGLAAAQEALKDLTEAARQVVHAAGILSDPEATDAQQVTASQVETEGIMFMAEILVRDALARGGGQQDTGE